MDIIDHLFYTTGHVDFLDSLIMLFGPIVVQNAHNIGVITIKRSSTPEYSVAYLNIH